MSDDGGDDGGSDDGVSEDDWDDDGGGGGGAPRLQRGSRGGSVRHLQRLLISRGYSCGPKGDDGIFLDGTQAAVVAFQRDHGLAVDGIVGGNTWRALSQSSPPRRPPPAAPSFSPRVASSGGSSSAGSNGCAVIIAACIVIALLWWFITVVLPILLAIAATVAGVALVLWILRACVRRFGWGPTLVGAFCSVAVPTLAYGYWELFMGDFEANRADVVAHTEPVRSAGACGSSLREGHNLTCVSKGCPPRDTVEGRWVQVFVSDAACWVSYGDVRFQHGVVLSALDRMGMLARTDQDDARARDAQQAALELRTEQLAGRGDLQTMLALARGHATASIAIPTSVAARFDDALSRARYAELLSASDAAEMHERPWYFAQAAALPAPSSKPELVERQRAWAAARCSEATQTNAGSRAALDVSVRAALAAAAPCARGGSAAIDGMVTSLLDRLAADPTGDVEARSAWLRALVDSAEIAAQLSAPTRERLGSTLEQAQLAVAAAGALAARAPRGVPAEVVLSARCAHREDSSVTTDVRLESRLRDAAGASVRAALTRVLAASYVRDEFALALEGLPVAATLRSAVFPIAAGERGWHVEAVSVDTCGRRAAARVGRVARRGAQASPPREVQLCWAGAETGWQICAADAGEAVSR